MRNFLSILAEICGKVINYGAPVLVVLYFAFQCTDIKLLEKKQIAASEQIVESQVAIYDALIQAEAANLIIQEQLAKGIDTAKADAIKRNDEVMKVIYGVDKRSISRDQDIVNGVNKVVDDVSYTLQKPSYDYLKNITVMLIAKAVDFDKQPKGKRGWLGTGVIIGIDKDYTYILTNRHVATSEENNGIKYNLYVKNGDDKYPVTVLKVSKDDAIDLALVRINGRIDGKRAVIGFGTAPKSQDYVYLVGHNLGRPFFYAEGAVAGYDPDGDDLVVDMPTGPGNSGSAVINKDGMLVGLLYAGSIIDQEGIMEMDTSHGLCVNIKAIRLFLAGYIEQ